MADIRDLAAHTGIIVDELKIAVDRQSQKFDELTKAVYRMQGRTNDPSR